MAYGTCTPCEAGSGVTKPILAVVLLFLALLALYVVGYIPICGADKSQDGEEAQSGPPGLMARLGGMLMASRASLPLLGWGKIIIGQCCPRA